MSPSRTPGESFGSSHSMESSENFESNGAVLKKSPSCISTESSNASDSDLESVSDDGPQNFFEGAEKLLEIWFYNKSGDLTGSDLRKIPRVCLEEMLQAARCEIISKTKNYEVDAYILSESSMFLSKRRFILKTCGTTTPLECLKTIIGLAKKFAGFDAIEEIFYSRKNFERPELQLQPYKSFRQEVASLDNYFRDGDAFCMGSLKHDRWYLYTLNPMDGFISRRGNLEADQTIEILMTELDPNIMSIFTKTVSYSARDATKKSGIDKLLPTMKIDDYLFDPCGYSMNGILQNESIRGTGLGEYMTIHITPEPEFSYVSFETNAALQSYSGLIQRVLKTFQPGKVIVTVFTNQTSTAADSHKDLHSCSDFGNWHRRDIQFTQVQNYELTFANFIRFPS